MTRLRRKTRSKRRKRTGPVAKRQIGCRAAVVLHNNQVKAQRKREREDDE